MITVNELYNLHLAFIQRVKVFIKDTRAVFFKKQRLEVHGDYVIRLFYEAQSGDNIVVFYKNQCLEILVRST